jgi:hypothetical protein
LPFHGYKGYANALQYYFCTYIASLVILSLQLPEYQLMIICTATKQYFFFWMLQVSEHQRRQKVRKTQDDGGDSGVGEQPGSLGDRDRTQDDL